MRWGGLSYWVRGGIIGTLIGILLGVILVKLSIVDGVGSPAPLFVPLVTGIPGLFVGCLIGFIKGKIKGEASNTDGTLFSGLALSFLIGVTSTVANFLLYAIYLNSAGFIFFISTALTFLILNTFVYLLINKTKTKKGVLLGYGFLVVIILVTLPAIV